MKQQEYQNLWIGRKQVHLEDSIKEKWPMKQWIYVCSLFNNTALGRIQVQAESDNKSLKVVWSSLKNTEDITLLSPFHWIVVITVILV